MKKEFNVDMDFDDVLSTETTWVYHCQRSLLDIIGLGTIIKSDNFELCRVEFVQKHIFLIYFQLRSRVNTGHIVPKLVEETLLMTYDVPVTFFPDKSIDNVWAFECLKDLLNDIRIGDEITIKNLKLTRVEENASFLPTANIIFFQFESDFPPSYEDMVNLIKSKYNEDVLLLDTYLDSNISSFACTEELFNKINIGDYILVRNVKLRRVESANKKVLKSPVKSLIRNYEKVCNRKDFDISMPECAEKTLSILCSTDMHTASLEDIRYFIALLDRQLKAEGVYEHVQSTFDILKAKISAEGYGCIRASNELTRQILIEIRPLDLYVLIGALKRNKDSAKIIENQSIVLFIGPTGAGKTTTVHFLAGSTLSEVTDEDGLRHFVPSNFPYPELSTFTTSAGSTSETSAINAIQMTLINGEKVGLCDCPGFNDTRGPEVDISNGLGIAKAMRGTRSVKPVIVLSGDLFGSRLNGFTEVCNTLANFISDLKTNVKSFTYLLTKVSRTEQSQILPKINNKLKNLEAHERSNEDLICLLEDIRNKVTAREHVFLDPLESDRLEVMRKLLNGSAVEQPSEVFKDFLSPQKSYLINHQLETHVVNVSKALDNLEPAVSYDGRELKCIRNNNIGLVRYKIEELKLLRNYSQLAQFTSKYYETSSIICGRLAKWRNSFFDNIEIIFDMTSTSFAFIKMKLYVCMGYLIRISEISSLIKDSNELKDCTSRMWELQRKMKSSLEGFITNPLDYTCCNGREVLVMWNVQALSEAASELRFFDLDSDTRATMKGIETVYLEIRTLFHNKINVMKDKFARSIEGTNYGTCARCLRVMEKLTKALNESSEREPFQEQYHILVCAIKRTSDEFLGSFSSRNDINIAVIDLFLAFDSEVSIIVNEIESLFDINEIKNSLTILCTTIGEFFDNVNVNYEACHYDVMRFEIAKPYLDMLQHLLRSTGLRSRFECKYESLWDIISKDISICTNHCSIWIEGLLTLDISHSADNQELKPMSWYLTSLANSACIQNDFSRVREDIRRATKHVIYELRLYMNSQDRSDFTIVRKGLSTLGAMQKTFRELNREQFADASIFNEFFTIQEDIDTCLMEVETRINNDVSNAEQVIMSWCSANFEGSVSDLYTSALYMDSCREFDLHPPYCIRYESTFQKVSEKFTSFCSSLYDLFAMEPPTLYDDKRRYEYGKVILTLLTNLRSHFRMRATQKVLCTEFLYHSNQILEDTVVKLNNIIISIDQTAPSISPKLLHRWWEYADCFSSFDEFIPSEYQDEKKRSFEEVASSLKKLLKEKAQIVISFIHDGDYNTALIELQNTTMNNDDKDKVISELKYRLRTSLRHLMNQDVLFTVPQLVITHEEECAVNEIMKLFSTTTQWANEGCLDTEFAMEYLEGNSGVFKFIQQIFGKIAENFPSAEDMSLKMRFIDVEIQLCALRKMLDITSSMNISTLVKYNKLWTTTRQEVDKVLDGASNWYFAHDHGGHLGLDVDHVKDIAPKVLLEQLKKAVTFSEKYMMCSQGIYSQLKNFFLDLFESVKSYFENSIDDSRLLPNKDDMNFRRHDVSEYAHIMNNTWSHTLFFHNVDAILGVDAESFLKLLKDCLDYLPDRLTHELSCLYSHCESAVIEHKAALERRLNEKKLGELINSFFDCLVRRRYKDASTIRETIKFHFKEDSQYFQEKLQNGGLKAVLCNLPRFFVDWHYYTIKLKNAMLYIPSYIFSFSYKFLFRDEESLKLGIDLFKSVSDYVIRRFVTLLSKMKTGFVNLATDQIDKNFLELVSFINLEYRDEDSLKLYNYVKRNLETHVKKTICKTFLYIRNVSETLCNSNQKNLTQLLNDGSLLRNLELLRGCDEFVFEVNKFSKSPAYNKIMNKTGSESDSICTFSSIIDGLRKAYEKSKRDIRKLYLDHDATCTLLKQDRDKFYVSVHDSLKFVEVAIHMLQPYIGDITNNNDFSECEDYVISQIEIFSQSITKVLQQIIPANMTEYYDRFDMLHDNLRSMMENFSGKVKQVAKTKFIDINLAFINRLQAYKASAALMESQWSNYSEHLNRVMATIIELKTLSLHIPVIHHYTQGKAILVESIIDQLLDSLSSHTEYGLIFIGKLGERLNAISLQNTDSTQPIAKSIISEHSAFKFYSQYLYVAKTEQFTIDMVLARIEGTGMDDGSKALLRRLYDSYLAEYKDIVETGQTKERRYLDQIRQNMREITKKDVPYRDMISSLLAHVSAYWTLFNSRRFQEEQHKLTENEFLLRPHSSQIVALFRLFGLDKQDSDSNPTDEDSSSKTSISNHFVEILTGEGKSLVIALCAVVLSLLNYDVHCVCYSKYLAQRDQQSFRAFFNSLQVKETIRYDTFKELCEYYINQNVDIRVEVEWLFSTGNINKKDEHSLESDSKPKILLIDEVDVFFRRDFYGNFYQPGVKLCSPEIVAFIKYLWSIRKDRGKLTVEHICATDEYRACVTRHVGWGALILESAKALIADLRKCDSHKYHFDSRTRRVGYKDQDMICTNTYYRYLTMFAYFKEHEAKNVDDAEMEKQIGLWPSCGCFSYGEVPKLYENIIGVTGTLKYLSGAELDIIQNVYKVKKRTFMPSVYGTSRLIESMELSVVPFDEYFTSLVNEIKRRLVGSLENIQRAVFVFFSTKQTLEEFRKSDALNSMRNRVRVITEDTPTDEREGAIKQAVMQGHITLLTREFGRGTDFIVYDDQLNATGGVHVIQTFVSSSQTEEVQIRGRTARQGNIGSISYFFSEKELESAGISQSTLEGPSHSENLKRIREFCNENFEKEYLDYVKDISKVQNDHEKSLRFQLDMKEGNIVRVKEYLLQRNTF